MNASFDKPSRYPSFDVSISIVSFNTRDLLERTIQAVLSDTEGLKAEIIVVDNASVDGSLDMVSEKFPSVHLVVNTHNRFFTAAHNQVVALSRGRYLLLLNSDVEIQPGTLPVMLQYLDTHPEVGIATTKLMFPDGRVQRNCARFASYHSMLLDYTFWGQMHRARRQQSHEGIWYADWERLTQREVDVAPGSFILVRREAIDAAGELDERLRLYFAEDDWCWRMRQAGFKILYLPVGGAIHPEGASVAQIRWLARRMYFEDMIIYARKYFGPWRAWWLWLLTRPTYWGMVGKAILRGGWRRRSRREVPDDSRPIF